MDDGGVSRWSGGACKGIGPSHKLLRTSPDSPSQPPHLRCLGSVPSFRSCPPLLGQTLWWLDSNLWWCMLPHKSGRRGRPPRCFFCILRFRRNLSDKHWRRSHAIVLRWLRNAASSMASTSCSRSCNGMLAARTSWPTQLRPGRIVKTWSSRKRRSCGLASNLSLVQSEVEAALRDVLKTKSGMH